VNDMFATIQRLYDEQRVLCPWRDWAKRHPVELILNDYAPDGQIFVLAPTISSSHLVVSAAETFRQLRQLMTSMNSPFPIRDQELAEMIAWWKADLKEPANPSSVPEGGST
jgi:hypothetical protein